MSHPEGSVHVPRRRYLLDSRWQTSVAGGTVAVAAVVALLGFLVSHALTSSERLERLSSGQIAMLAVLVNAAYIALLTSALVFVTIRLTHTVAGPAKVLQGAIEALCAERFDSRLELRRHDYLKDLAHSVATLSEHLRTRRETERQLVSALEAALARNDLRAAKESARALRGMAETTAQERQARVAA